MSSSHPAQSHGRHRPRHGLRHGLGLTALAVAATTLLAPAVPAGAAPGTPAATAGTTAAAADDATADARPAGDSAEAAAAGAWLAGQLTDGLLFNPQFGGFNDYGLTVDAGLALDRLEVQDDAVAAITGAITDDIDSYTTGVDFDSDDIYSGAVAKALAFLQQQGVDGTDVGGVDVLTRLEDRVATDAPITGRLEDQSEFADSANSIGQAFGARALTAAESPLAGDVTAYLLQQQCAEGYFRLSFTQDKTAADQTCVGADEGAPDPDTTALVGLQLLPLAADGDAGAQVAVDRAATWLQGVQRADGSFTGASPTDQPNTNSTGLAGTFLDAHGDTAAATEAADWVARHQAAACADTPLAADRGALAYQVAPLNEAAADGITDATRDQFRRATAQAATVLPLASEGTVQVGTGRGYQHVGHPFDVSLGGVSAERQRCLTLPTGRGLTLAPGQEEQRAYAASQPGRQSLTVAGLSGQGADSVVALAKETLPVVAFRDDQGNAVVVRGLARGERVTVRVRGEVVARGFAGKGGAFFRRFEATGPPTAAYAGARGAFGDRRGGSGFRVS